MFIFIINLIIVIYGILSSWLIFAMIWEDVFSDKPHIYVVLTIIALLLFYVLHKIRDLGYVMKIKAMPRSNGYGGRGTSSNSFWMDGGSSGGDCGSSGGGDC